MLIASSEREPVLLPEAWPRCEGFRGLYEALGLAVVGRKDGALLRSAGDAEAALSFFSSTWRLR